MVDITNALTNLKRNFTLPSRTEPHIFKNPSQALYTRKKERVSEGDVMYMTRPDGYEGDTSNDRINENIRYWPTAQNASVGINYQNFRSGGSRTTHFSQVQASNPYKVEVVRPPLYPIESLNALSRPRTWNTSATTNAGIPYAFNNSMLQQAMDKQEIYDIISVPKANGMILSPNAFYKLETPQILQITNEVRSDPLKYTATSNLSIPKSSETSLNPTSKYEIRNNFYHPQYSITANYSENRSTELTEESLRQNKKSEVKDQNLILNNIKSGYAIIIYDPTTHNHNEVVGSIKDKNNISVTAALKLPIEVQSVNGCSKKIKDYTYKIIKSNVSQDKLVITLKENDKIELERNVPVYAATTNPCDLNGSEVCNMRHDISGKERKASHVYTNTRDYAVTQSNDPYKMMPTIREKPLTDKNEMLMHMNDRVYDLGTKFKTK